MPDLPFLTADDVRDVTVRQAVRALEAALTGPQLPQQPRTALHADAGSLLLMPAQSAAAVGVKLVTVTPGNAALGLPRVQGVYVLFDGRTLAPVALVDAVALTDLRTSSVSALALDRLAPPAAGDLVVFGTGPQALAHIAAIRAVRPVHRVRVVGRDPARTAAFAERVGGQVADAGAVEDADVVCCCTTSTVPLFAGSAVREGACVLAVGAHEPAAREVDTDLVRRAFVTVEERGTALREAGDLLLPLAEGAVRPQHVRADLAELVGGARPLPGQTTLFVSVGMAWEDLAVASLVHDRWLFGRTPSGSAASDRV